jgi:outer membrane protein assembly factor BamD
LLGCAAKRQTVRLDAEDQFTVGKREFDSRKYPEAIESLRRLIFEHPGFGKIDEAQFLIARSYYEMKDYLQAESEFRQIILNYVDSPYSEDASYYVAMTHYMQIPAYYLDQSETMKAIDMFSRFLVKYPESKFAAAAKDDIASCRDKLARKDLESGRLYMKLGVFKSAIVYFDYVIAQYGDTKWSEEAKKLLDECHDKIGSAEPDTSHSEK